MASTEDFQLVADMWKHKKMIWENYCNIKTFTVVFSSLMAFAGFIMKSRTLRRTMIKRNLIQSKKMNLEAITRLNLIERPGIFQTWNTIVNDESCPQPMLLIEGYQGIGKSFLVQWFVQEQSKVRPTLYISLRDINIEKWRDVIGKQIGFLPENFPFSNQYDYAPMCLLESFHELKESRMWWFAPLSSSKKKKRPLLVLDDAQKIFKNKNYENIQDSIINSLLIPIRDKNEASIFLVTSDYSIESDMILSGMSTRYEIFPFPKIEQKDFERSMQMERQNLQKINNKLNFENLLKYYEDFNTDLRSLNVFIIKFNGDYEETKRMLVFNEIKLIEKYLADEKSFRNECEILLHLFNHKVLKLNFFQNFDVDDIQKKKKALDNLIHKNIVRESSSQYGSFYEFHSPKYRLAIQILKTKELN